jgi:hypothetical protein
MIVNLLKIESPKVKHAVVSVMSMLSSTEKGRVYLLNNNEESLVPFMIKVLWFKLAHSLC